MPFIGPSSSIGAARPFSRSPAVKVVVFQWPCGTAARPSLAASGPAAQPRHLRGGGGLVDEDQLLGVEIELALEPGSAAAQNVGTLLL